jgi:hypothetical protein
MTAIIALKDGPWSLARLTDEVALRLAVLDHYYAQVRALMYRIPVCEPTPPFIISLTDLTERIRAELEASKRIARLEVLREAVGRIFENVDYSYFHASVKKRLVVELR